MAAGPLYEYALSHLDGGRAHKNEHLAVRRIPRSYRSDSAELASRVHQRTGVPCHSGNLLLVRPLCVELGKTDVTVDIRAWSIVCPQVSVREHLDLGR